MFFGVLFRYYRTAKKRNRWPLTKHSWNTTDLKIIGLFLPSFKFTTFIFLSQRRDTSSRGKGINCFLFSDCFRSLWNISKKNARELGVACRQFHAGVKWSLQCVVQANFNVLSNIANAFGNIANAFENNNSVLESVFNRLKNVQCIFQRIWNAFLTYLLCRVFANRVTDRLMHPTETAIRRLQLFFLNPDYVAACSLRLLCSNKGAYKNRGANSSRCAY